VEIGVGKYSSSPRLMIPNVASFDVVLGKEGSGGGNAC
jgi:hypothetical protein